MTKFDWNQNVDLEMHAEINIYDGNKVMLAANDQQQ